MTTNNITTQYRERLASLNEALAALDRGESLEFQYGNSWEELNTLTNGWANDVMQGLYLIRVKPKPEPKIPDGVFWVREQGKKPEFLVLCVTDCVVVMGSSGRLNFDYSVLFSYFNWSRDRVTWFTFTGEEVKG